MEQAYAQLARQFDHKWGGFGGAPKFPTPHNLLFLMRYADIMQEPNAMKMVEITLEDMASGGIFDQIGGGWRFKTDAAALEEAGSKLASAEQEHQVDLLQ